MNPTIHTQFNGKKFAVTAFIPSIPWHDPNFRLPGMHASTFPETGLLALSDGRVVRLVRKHPYQVRTLENGQIMYEAAPPSPAVVVTYQFPGYPDLQASCPILKIFPAGKCTSSDLQTLIDHNGSAADAEAAAKDSMRLSAIALANPGQLGTLKKPGEWEAAVIGRYHAHNWTILVLSNRCAFAYRPNLLPLKDPDVSYRAIDSLERIRIVAPEVETANTRYDNDLLDDDFTKDHYQFESGVIYPATVMDWEHAQQQAGMKPTDKPAAPAPSISAEQLASLTNLARGNGKDFAKAFCAVFNPASIKPARVSRIRDLVMHRLQDSARWSYRALAQKFDVSHTNVARELALFHKATGIDLAPPRPSTRESLAQEAADREQSERRKATSADYRNAEEKNESEL